MLINKQSTSHPMVAGQPGQSFWLDSVVDVASDGAGVARDEYTTEVPGLGVWLEPVSPALVACIESCIQENALVSITQPRIAKALLAQFPELVPDPSSKGCTAGCSCAAWFERRHISKVQEWCEHIIAAWLALVEMCNVDGFMLLQMRGCGIY